RPSAFRIQTLRRLTGGPRVLHDGREAVLALANLDVARLVKHVDAGLGRHSRRTRAQRQGDLPVAVHQTWSSARLRRLSSRGRAEGDETNQSQHPESLQ